MHGSLIESAWEYVKEISNTELLVSLCHDLEGSANLDIIEKSNLEKLRRIETLQQSNRMEKCS